MARVISIHTTGSMAQQQRLSGLIAKDPLSDMAHAVAVICDMRRHDGDGGSTETPKEQLDALPALKEARASLTAYIASIERLRAVA